MEVSKEICSECVVSAYKPRVGKATSGGEGLNNFYYDSGGGHRKTSALLSQDMWYWYWPGTPQAKKWEGNAGELAKKRPMP